MLLELNKNEYYGNNREVEGRDSWAPEEERRQGSILGIPGHLHRKHVRDLRVIFDVCHGDLGSHQR